MAQEVVHLGPQLARQPPVVLEEADHQLVVARVRDVGAHKELALEEQLADGGRNLRPGGLQVSHLHLTPVDFSAHSGNFVSLFAQIIFCNNKRDSGYIFADFFPVTGGGFGAFFFSHGGFNVFQ